MPDGRRKMTGRFIAKLGIHFPCITDVSADRTNSAPVLADSRSLLLNPIEKASLPPSLLSQKEIDLRSHLPRSLAHSVDVKHVFARPGQERDGSSTRI